MSKKCRSLLGATNGANEDATLSGLVEISMGATQGSLAPLRQKHFGGQATLGWRSESLWDSGIAREEEGGEISFCFDESSSGLLQLFDLNIAEGNVTVIALQKN